MEDATDSELLSRLCAGDQEALAALVTRYYGLVHAACRRQTAPGDDEDCAQAVFLILARRPAAAARAPALVAWLQRTSWFVCRNMRRSVLRRRQAEGEVRKSSRTVDGVPAAEALDHLDACLQRLPRRQRAAVTLHYLSGKCPDEVATILGTSRENAYQLLSRGLAGLRVQLARRGVAIGGAGLSSVLGGAAQAATARPSAAFVARFSGTPSAGTIDLTHAAMKAMAMTALTPFIAAAVLVLAACTLTLALSAEASPTPSASPAAEVGTGPHGEAAPEIPRPAWASASGKDQFGSWADLQVAGVTQRFRWILPGSFSMGSPKTEQAEAERATALASNPGSPPDAYSSELLHQVTLTTGFWLADSACTQALWVTISGSNPAFFRESARRPVEQVSWNDCQQFLALLNARIPGAGFRLPSEAQWEYACRAGSSTAYSCGATITTDQVNFNGLFPFGGAKMGENRSKTVPVKSLPPNQWGLFEMHGNVDQWCSDWAGEYREGAVRDPMGPRSGSERVVRGGSFMGWALDCRSAMRDSAGPDTRGRACGFRISAPATWSSQ